MDQVFIFSGTFFILLKIIIIKKVAIIQSNYIPWKGYFDIINLVDEFILLDDVQYTKRDWRNRNILKTSAGPKWITIPVNVKGNYTAAINEITVSDADWGEKHWQQLKQHYSKAPFFNSYGSPFKDLYLNSDEIYLSKINSIFIREINNILGIKTKMSWSSDYHSEGASSLKLVSLCKSCGADNYLSGPLARDYLDESLFIKESIKVEWMDYCDYPEYPQLNPPFMHGVSIFDLIFNTGAQSTNFMKSFSKP